jgi:SpoVK/Ycf46/Vps4 family AAA+-type ATPase
MNRTPRCFKFEPHKVHERDIFSGKMGEEVKMDVVDEELEQKTTEVFNTMPWVEKYRPNNLDELIAHEEIIQILNKLIDSNKLPHLLFYGPPGTGENLLYLIYFVG